MDQKKHKNTFQDLNLAFSTNPNAREEMEDIKEVSSQSFQQRIRVQLDTKHRAGKAVSRIMGLEETQNKLEELCKFFKQKCGVGGAVKEGEILIQGDHVNKIIQMLIEKGYKNTKRTGG